jgi:two-component system sensor histidine kinase UhpB
MFSKAYTYTLAALLVFTDVSGQIIPRDVSPQVSGVIQRASGFMSRSAYDSAAFVLNQAFSEPEVSYAERELYYLLSYEAENMYYNALFEQGLSSALRGLEIAESLKNDTLIGNAENIVGLMYMSMDKYEVALDYFRNSISHTRRHQLDFLSYRYQVLANAAECFLKLQIPDSAFTYAEMGLEEVRELKRIRGEAIIYWTLAEAWLQKENYESAELSVSRALALVDTSGNRDLVLTLYTSEMRINAALRRKGELLKWMDLGLKEIENPLNTDYARSEFLETATDLCVEFNELQRGAELMRSWKLLQKKLIEKQQNQRLNALKDYYEKNQRLVLAKEHGEVQRRQIELQNTMFVFLGILSVLLIILIAVVLIYFRQRQRISKLEHKEQLRKNELDFEMRSLENRIMAVSEERNRIASDLHDDIGASLSSIRIYSGAASKKFNDDPEEAQRLIERINNSSSGMMDRMSDIVWSINPKNDNVESILFRMKSQAGEVLAPLEVDVEYAIDKEAESIQPSMTARRNIYLVFKEAINNIAKYSAATHVWVELNVKQGMLHLIIRDNGAGFEVSQSKSGNGLSSMRQRAESLGGTLNIVSAPGAGTELRVEFQIARISDGLMR